MADASASPESTDSTRTIFEELAEESAAADAFLAAPCEPTLHDILPEQAHLLDTIRPH